MNDPLRPGKHAKFRSNLRNHQAMAAADMARLQKDARPLLAAERKFQRERRALLTKAAVKPAPAIFQAATAAYAKAVLRANGDRTAIANARRRARREIDRALQTRIPRYREYEALRQRFAVEHRALMDAHRAERLLLGGLTILPGDFPSIEFTSRLVKPPYSLVEVVPTPSGDPSNRSFADARAGRVVTNVEDRTSDPPSTFGFSFNPGVQAQFSTAVGFEFQIPKTGFLFGSAVLENVRNSFTLALNDELGFSSGDLDVEHAIFIRIIRSGEATTFERVLLSDGLQSSGSDLSFSLSPVQQGTSFTLSFEPRDAFLKGERIQILAGASVTTRTQLDDMNSFFSAQTVWRVRQIAAGIRV